MAEADVASNDLEIRMTIKMGLRRAGSITGSPT